MTARRTFVIVALGVAAAPLTVARAHAAEALDRGIWITPRYLDAQKKPMTGSQLPKSVVLATPLIVGSIGGRPSTRPVWLGEISVDQGTSFDLATLDGPVRGMVAPRTAEAAAAGLIVEPADTRFARLATYTIDPASRREIGATGLRDAATNALLLLMYFDRPCRVRGVLREGDAESTVDLVAISSGFHFVRVEELTPKRFRMTIAPRPRQLALTIEPVGDFLLTK